ncbi:MAG: magnesium transporter [Sedimentisphaerales bacterium]
MPAKLSDHNLQEPVSAYMRTDFVSLKQNETVAHAIKSIRDNASPKDILYLYVTDEHNRLTGVVPIRNVITSDPQTKISSIMVRSPVSVQHWQSVLHACELFTEYRFLALPVVDDDNKILGIVDINLFTDDVVSLNHQRQLENVFQMIGVHVSIGKKEVSPWSDFKGRFPWLFCNITSGIICAFIASRYELLISELAILAMFITVVLAISESVSIQSMALTLQVLLQRNVSWRRILMGVRSELLTSVLLGAGSGLVVGLTAYLWKGVLWQGLAIGLSIWLSVITACLLGVIVPTLIRKFRIDPKVAAGPIVLAAADIATMAFYFSTANLILG